LQGNPHTGSERNTALRASHLKGEEEEKRKKKRKKREKGKKKSETGPQNKAYLADGL
jgi:hypothetical protein